MNKYCKLIPLMVLVVLLAGTASALLTDDLLSLFTMNSDTTADGGVVQDVAGFLNMTDDSTTNIAGIIGEARNFTGDRMYSSGNPLNYSSHNFTVSVWVKAANWPGNENNAILSKDIGNSDRDWNIMVGTGGADMSVTVWENDGTAITITEAISSFPEGEWYHIVLRANISYIEMFVNGTQYGEAAYDGTIRGSNADLRVGLVSNYWAGTNASIDQIAYWNRSLSNAEIAELYNDGAGVAWPFAVAPVLQGPILNDSTVHTNEDVACTWNASQNDGDDINVTGRWYKDDSLISGMNWTFEIADDASTTINLTNGNYNRDEVIICEVLADDGTLNTIANSSSLTILNTTPTFTQPLENHTTYETVAFTYDINCSDTDSDLLQYLINDTNFDIDNETGIINATFPSGGGSNITNIEVACEDGPGSNSTDVWNMTVLSSGVFLTQVNPSVSILANTSLQVNITYQHQPDNFDGNCTLVVNTTERDNLTGVVHGSTIALNWTVPSEGNWTYYVECTASDFSGGNTTALWYYYDDLDPVILSSLYQNDTYYYPVYNNTMYMTFNFSDTNLYITNISDTVYNWSITHEGVTDYALNLTLFMENHTQDTVYNMTATACDGHTGNDIGIWNNQIVGKELRFDDNKVKIYPYVPSKYKEPKIGKEPDRYTFEFETYENPENDSHIFYVYSDSKLEIARGTKYKGHIVAPELLKWIDFEDGTDSKVKLKRINDNLIEVEVENKNKKLKFKSIGNLNCRVDTYQYYYGNVTLGYPATTFEGREETYWIQFSRDGIIVPDINLTSFEYNDSNYSTTKGLPTGYVNFTRTISTGYLEYVDNRTLQWNYTVYNESLAATSFSTDIYNQTGSQVRILDCNATYIDGTTVNVTFYEEMNLTTLNASIEALFETGTGEFNRSFNFSHAGVEGVDYCIFPLYANITANITFIYTNATGFDTREYFIDELLLTNQSHNISLYLTLNALTQNVFFLVYDEQYREQADVLIKVQRHYPELGGIYQTVQQVETGWDGLALLQLIENTTNYKFTFSIDGTTRLITSPMRILCRDPSSYKCIITFNLEGTPTTLFEGHEGTGVAATWSYNNDTKVISFTFDDPSGATTNMRLEVIRSDIGGIISICNDTLATSSGTMTCNVSAYSTGLVRARAYRSASPFSWMSSYTVSLEEWWRIAGQEGLFLSMIFIMTVSFTALRSPALSIVMTAFGMIGLFAIRGVSSIGWTGLVTFICLAIITLIVVIRHRKGGGYI